MEVGEEGDYIYVSLHYPTRMTPALRWGGGRGRRGEGVGGK